LLRDVLFVLVLIGSAAGPAAAQMAPDVHLPRVDLGVTQLIYRYENASGQERWSPAGLAVSVTRNVTDRVGLGFQAARTARALSALAGPRLNSGFFYGSERDPIPGRFFLELLAGAAVRGVDGATRPAVQTGAGVDLLIAPSHGVSLRWELAYHTASGDPADRSNYRFMIGVLFGPRIPR
jgi:hypothetical protein